MKEYRLRVKEKIMKADLATIRREYTKGGLKRSDLPDNYKVAARSDRCGGK